MGHYSKQCTEPWGERKQQANLAQGQEEEPALLLMSLCALTETTVCTMPVQQVLLNKKHSKAKATNAAGSCNTAWFLDSGASNHMCGRREFFTKLDISVRGSVKLGDDTSVEIEGRGTILFTCRNGKHLALEQVYFIPRLRSNIVSLGQLDEIGYDMHIQHGLLRGYVMPTDGSSRAFSGTAFDCTCSTSTLHSQCASQCTVPRMRGGGMRATAT
jgi:hypothetical protein